MALGTTDTIRCAGLHHPDPAVAPERCCTCSTWLRCPTTARYASRPAWVGLGTLLEARKKIRDQNRLPGPPPAVLKPSCAPNPPPAETCGQAPSLRHASLLRLLPFDVCQRLVPPRQGFDLQSVASLSANCSPEHGQSRKKICNARPYSTLAKPPLHYPHFRDSRTTGPITTRPRLKPC
jgi:hypothetical protein